MKIPSGNAGLKNYEILRSNPGYHAREALLKELFEKYGPQASMYDIYEELQGIDRSVSTGLGKEDFAALKQLAADMSEKWKDCFTDTGRDSWWKFSVECADPAVPWLNDLALIKVYVSVEDSSVASEVFTGIVRLLLEKSDNRFHAKISRVKRRDSMCFWVSRYAFFLLEKYLAGEGNIVSGFMPFIAYRGKLGISRELATFDSHTSIQALLISRYFRTEECRIKTDLGDMYSLLVRAWNGQLPDSHPLTEVFRYERAQSILLLLDTMDVITERTQITDDHLFLQECGKMWRALGIASDWNKAERFYQAELEKGEL